MKKMKWLPALYCLIGLGLLSWGAVVPAWGAIPNINNIDGQAALGGITIIYIDQTNNITIDGNNAGSFNAVTLTVDGADAAYTTSNSAGNFNTTFNTSASAIFKQVRVRAQESTSDAQRILVDVMPPNTPNIRWRLPQDQPCMASNLSRIYTDSISDVGGAGIDWSRCYITVSSVSGSTSDSGGVLDFNPNSGYPGAPGHEFDTGTIHNLFVRVYDMAGNSSTDNDSFCFNGDAPVPRIRWESPNRGYPPSYYVGQGLTRIWADCGCSFCNPTPIINYAASTMSVLPLPAPNAGSKADGDGFIDWQIIPPPVYHTNFTNGTLYTVTVYVEDIHGESGMDTRQFMKDEDCPIIGNIQVINALMSPVDLANDDIVMRGSQMRTPYYFISDITDLPNDWGGHTSLNGSGISYDGYAPSSIGILEEDAGSVSGSLNYTALGLQNYQGRFIVPGTHSPESGVHWLRNWARDWAYYGNTDHEDYAEARFLVDDIPPQVNNVQLPLIPNDFVVTDSIYIKAYDLSVYPEKISVTAQDQPEDRNPVHGTSFPDRLDCNLSTVKLINPDGAEYSLDSNNNWVRDGSDLNNIFDTFITPGNPVAIFPYPDFGGNTIDGRHTIAIHLQDQITANFGSPNVRDASYYFYNDVSLPHLVSFFSTIPFPGSYTSSFPDVQATIMDPNLRDGSPGSGLDLDACQVEVYTGLNNASVQPSEYGELHLPPPFTGHRGQLLAEEEYAEIFLVSDIDQAVRDYHSWSESEYPTVRKCYVYVTAKVIDSTNGIEVDGLTPGEKYMVGWKIPSVQSHDGMATIGATPNQAVTRDGFYFMNFYVADAAGNTGQIDSIAFNYISAGGLITLTADPQLILADGISESVITTSPIYLGDSPGTVVSDGTLVTVSSSLGDIISADADAILPGMQVMTLEGIAAFIVRSRHSEDGKATLRARTASGFANSGDVNNQLEMILANMADMRVEVRPAMEKMTAEYKIMGRVNFINNLVSGIDKISGGNRDAGRGFIQRDIYQ